MKTAAYLAMAFLTFTGCDCLQCAEGTIKDARDLTPLDSVKVTSYTDDELTEEIHTESNGEYKVCASTTPRCGYLKVTFEKNGYKSQEFIDPEYDLNILMVEY